MRSFSLSHFGVARRIYIVAVAAVSALATGCGGGDHPETPLAAPSAFVPRANELSSSLSDADKHDLNAGVMAQLGDDVIRGRGCFYPYLSRPLAFNNATVRPPVQTFDNLYYMGTVGVGQIVLKTNTGFILFDTMNQASDVTGITIPQLTQLGLNIANLRHIVLTHGHFDHDGGAQYLQTTYGTPVSIGAADYVGKPYKATTLPTTSTAPTTVTFDDVPITTMWTPGHTTGTMSFVLPVTHKGVAHKAMYYGGGAHPTNAAALAQYLASTEAMYDLALQTGADTIVGSHAFFDGSDERMDTVDAIGGYDKQVSNPMIQGTERVLMSFAALRECTAALLGRADATVKTPSWFPTQTEFYAAAKRASGAVSVAARVSNAYHVVSGGTVKFSVAGGTASCEATTNAEGIATCDIANAGSSVADLRADFSKQTSATAVNLPSWASLTLK